MGRGDDSRIREMTTFGKLYAITRGMYLSGEKRMYAHDMLDHTDPVSVCTSKAGTATGSTCSEMHHTVLVLCRSAVCFVAGILVHETV